MIPKEPDILKNPLAYEGDKRVIPEDTPLGTNQFSVKGGFPPILHQYQQKLVGLFLAG